jgi:ureidoglycolate lyase
MRLAPRQISVEAFAPFGTLIEARLRPPEPINAGTTQRHSDLASLDLRAPGCDPRIGIYVARARAFPLTIAKLERHRQASQVFIPMGGHAFVVVVAPGGESPEWEGLHAFVTGPGQAIALRRGCWHHGLVALGDGDRFAVIEGGNYREDTEERTAPGPIELEAPPGRG